MPHHVGHVGAVLLAAVLVQLLDCISCPDGSLHVEAQGASQNLPAVLPA